MNGIKDLFEITEDDFKKKDLPKENSNIIEKPKAIIEEDDSPEEAEVKIEKPDKKKKKHFEYKNGKVKYVNLFSSNKKIDISEIKSEVIDGIKINANRVDKSFFLRNIAILIIVFSFVFIYFFYISDYLRDVNEVLPTAPTQNGVIADNTSDENQSTITEQNKPKPNNSNSDINLLTSDEIIYSVKNCNGQELDKIEKYLEVKSNRVSTVSDIKKHKKEKEALYMSLIESKERLTMEEFKSIENLIIKSIGMSKEFLTAFEESKGNSEIRKIIEKYTREGKY